MDYILIKTKEDFKKVRTKYKSDNLCWKLYMWDFFKEKTCYIPDEDCFISQKKALSKRGVEIKN
jgi:hypothetical protein